jgi:Spy/CpxP family protein refolding chaperone
MMRRMTHRDPQEQCRQHIARGAGMVAYTVALLNLTPEQRPLWDKLNSILQQRIEKGQQLCSSIETSGQDAILDRLDRAERFLSAQLQTLQQVRPALEQLYQALTPEQKSTLNRALRRHPPG